MYQPPLFKVDDPARLHDAIEQFPFATLASLNATGLVASHLPLVLDRAAGPHGTLRGHLARPNHQLADLAPETEALAIFLGPQAYVSPSWYPSKQAHGKVVPTWNYIAVHAYGRLALRDDPDWLLAHLTALTEQHERDRTPTWRLSDAPPDYLSGMLKGIVGLELTISRLEGKWKLSQNREPADAAGAHSGLAASADPAARSVAAAMAALPPRQR